MFEKIKNIFHKKNRKNDNGGAELALETEAVDDVNRFMKEPPPAGEEQEVSDETAALCQRLIDATYQMEDQRAEYESVTEYFDDISRIEQMPDNMRRELNDIAMKIEFLEQNQAEFKKLNMKLSDDKYRIISKYEGDIPGIMRRLSELETRNTAIRHDMEHLENEKDAQDYYTAEAEERQGYLRSIAISVGIMGVITLLVVYWVYRYYVFSIEVAVTAVFFVITLIYVLLYLKYRSEVYEIKLAQAKKQRAITILNKVKIKYVNSASTLDYIYEKYQIKSLRELEYLWDQYNMLVQETKKFQHSIGDMRVYIDEMEKLLSGIGVKDPYIWTQQTSALLDDREMVEVKHSMNTRRQSLRAGIENNEKIKEQCLRRMKQKVSEEPGLMETVRETLAAYHIEF